MLQVDSHLKSHVKVTRYVFRGYLKIIKITETFNKLTVLTLLRLFWNYWLLRLNIRNLYCHRRKELELCPIWKLYEICTIVRKLKMIAVEMKLKWNWCELKARRKAIDVEFSVLCKKLKTEGILQRINIKLKT